MTALTIGKVANAAGVGVETIRYYERRGLIARPRRPERGFRTYPNAVVKRIQFIRRAQQLGFSLKEIDALLALRANPATDCADVQRRANAKLAEVERKMIQLRRIQGALETVIAACPASGALVGCSIIEALETNAL